LRIQSQQTHEELESLNLIIFHPIIIRNLRTFRSIIRLRRIHPFSLLRPIFHHTDGILPISFSN